MPLTSASFIALDVESANADMASICQIGVARYERGSLAGEWATFVDPGSYFDPIHVSIHGIDQAKVAGAPTFQDVAYQLAPMLAEAIVVTHTHFDRVALHQAAIRSDVEPFTCTWLDSARVARRAWEKFSRSGYGLTNVCREIGYDFQHHDALEDAKACGAIILAALTHTGIELSAWVDRTQRSWQRNRERIEREGDPNGALSGEVVVFTGRLEIPRREAADLAASAGCRVEDGVTKETTLLVVGDQDVQQLAGHSKSSKHRKAEQLISRGAPIRILRETDFKELIATEIFELAEGRAISRALRGRFVR